MIHVVALHGFLGLPTDWNSIKEKLPEFDFNCIDLWAHLKSPLSLNSISQKILEIVSTPPESTLLLGYSLGGRLALHLLDLAPEKFGGAVIVSAHSGLSLPQERSSRKAADSAWADRFENESWDTLIDSWNGQPVLSTSNGHLIKNEALYSRTSLSLALRYLSLGLQIPFENFSNFPKTLWITGERDIQFNAVAENLKNFSSSFDFFQCPNAGHRVPWDNPDVFMKRFEDFATNTFKEIAYE